MLHYVSWEWQFSTFWWFLKLLFAYLKFVERLCDGVISPRKVFARDVSYRPHLTSVILLLTEHRNTRNTLTASQLSSWSMTSSFVVFKLIMYRCTTSFLFCFRLLGVLLSDTNFLIPFLQNFILQSLYIASRIASLLNAIETSYKKSIVTVRHLVYANKN